MKYHITFGYDHIHEIDGILIDKDVVVSFDASSWQDARDKVSRAFGDRYCMLSITTPQMEYFKRGIIILGL